MMKCKTIFDRRKVERVMREKSIRSLNHAGAAIRLTARRSIRRSKKVSLPGQPPNTRFGQLKRSLRYSVDKVHQRVLIGPTYSGVGRSMTAHEFGGYYRGGRYPRRPLMGPALMKIKERLPKMWAASIK
jgi:hypothetical protein